MCFHYNKVEDGIRLPLVDQHDASQSKASLSMCNITRQLVLDGFLGRCSW